MRGLKEREPVPKWKNTKQNNGMLGWKKKKGRKAEGWDWGREVAATT